MPIIYLDNSATTKVCPEAAKKAFEMMTETYGNPSSLHSLGYQAEVEMTKARKSVASLLGARPEEITFTTGGSEGNNLALFGAAEARKRYGKHIITTAVEHSSVANSVTRLEAMGYEVTRLVPESNGMITVEQLEAALRDDTILVSIMMVNNETGALFPIAKLAALTKKRAPKALFHCDAVQAAGKLPINLKNLPVDLLTISGHKLHAPKGSGALFIRKGVRIMPLIYGGGQESGMRSGTEATPAICALGEAIRCMRPLAEQEQIFQQLYDELLESLQDLDGVVVHQPEVHVPYICNFSMPGYKSETLLHYLSQRGIYVSSGSACAKGKKSAVLTSMHLADREIDSAIRVSLSSDNTIQEIQSLIETLGSAKQDLVHT